MEDQQSFAETASAAAGMQSGAASGNTSADSVSASSAAQARAEGADRQRRLQGLQMQRERILSERTSSPHRRSALENALASIERELEQLGWTIHI